MNFQPGQSKPLTITPGGLGWAAPQLGTQVNTGAPTLGNFQMPKLNVGNGQLAGNASLSMGNGALGQNGAIGNGHAPRQTASVVSAKSVTESLETNRLFENFIFEQQPREMLFSIEFSTISISCYSFSSE